MFSMHKTLLWMIKLFLIAKLKINTGCSEKDSQFQLAYGIGLLINYCYCWHFALLYLFL